MLRVWNRLVIMGTFLLTLVRHGETAENKLKIVQGHTDTKLVEIGVRQAVLVGQRLQNETFSHVFSSDLSRARETCEIIIKHNVAGSASISLDSRLRERKLGVLEGQSQYSCCNFIRTNRKNLPPGMETKLEVRERAKSFFRELCSTVCKKVAHLNKTSKAHNFQCPCTDPNCRGYCLLSVDQPLGKETGGGLLGSLCNVNDTNAKTSNHLMNCAVTAKLENSPDKMKISLESLSDEEHLGITPDVLQFGRKAQPAASTDNDPVVPDLLGPGKDGIVVEMCSAFNQSSLPGESCANDGHGDEKDGGERPTSCSGGDGQHHIANVLLVSHGGFLLELINYFFKELKCKVPSESGMEAAFTCATVQEAPKHSIMSNAGVSTFVIDMSARSAKPTAMSCLFLNDRKHLSGDAQADSVMPGVADLVC